MRSASVVPALLIAACTSADPPAATTPTPPPVPVDSPTFYRDIAPILERYCTRCHDGVGLGPGDYRDPEVVLPLAALLLARMDAGEMPPPAADPACNPYDGADRLFLEAGDRDRFAAWTEAGSPLGDPASGTASPWPEQHLSASTHLLATAAPYVPDFADGNEYRCLILDWNEPADTWITGFEVRIDHAQVSHHTMLLASGPGQAEANVTDPATRSWACASFPANDWSVLHTWAPGNNPVELPAGRGMFIAGGSQLVLQMHYFPGGPAPETVADSPGFWLNTTDAVDAEVSMFPLGIPDFVIPAGVSDHTESITFSTGQFGQSATTVIYGVFPHMHVLGKRYDFHATTPSGDEKCIAQADAYDFENQPTYWFDEPVRLEPEDAMTVSCTWDNSAANPAQLNPTPQDVVQGENTDQEMCYAFTYAEIEGP